MSTNGTWKADSLGSTGYARTPFKNAAPSNSIVLLGDSFTSGQFVNQHYSDRGIFTWANIFLGQAFDVLKNAGVSGQRSDLIKQRVDDDVIAYNPAWCLLLAGINDIVQDKSVDFIFGNIKDICDKLIANNIRVILMTVPPSSSYNTTSKKQTFYALNRKLKEFARTNFGIILVDVGALNTNPADTTAITGSTVADGLHLSANGACKFGEKLATELKNHIPYVPPTLSYSKDDQLNLLGNGVMYGTAGTATTGATGTVADNWILISSNATVVGSKAARTDTLGGEMQRVTISGGGTTGFSQLYREILTGFAVGETIQGQWEIQVDPSSVVTERIDMLIEFRNASNTVIDSVGGLFHESSNPALNYTPKGTLIIKTPPYVIPTTTTKVRLTSKAYMTSGIIDYGLAEIKKL